MKLDFSQPQVVTTIAKPRSGKTFAIRWMILKNTIDNRHFKYGIVFTRTGKWNEDWKFIPDQYVFENYDPEILQSYLDGIKSQKNIVPSFIAFDDIQGLLNANDPVLTSLIACHRHFKISLFFCFQYIYGKGSIPILRECTTYALLFNSKGDRTLRALYENFGQLFDTFKDFKKHFLSVTSEKYVAMLYLQDENDLYNNYMYFRAPAEMDNFKNIKLDY